MVKKHLAVFQPLRFGYASRNLDATVTRFALSGDDAKYLSVQAADLNADGLPEIIPTVTEKCEHNDLLRIVAFKNCGDFFRSSFQHPLHTVEHKNTTASRLIIITISLTLTKTDLPTFSFRETMFPVHPVTAVATSLTPFGRPCTPTATQSSIPVWWSRLWTPSCLLHHADG